MSRSRHHFNRKGKKAESFVHELALKTFLTDWCFLNPSLPNKKELCDLLVVFDNVAIIWQIKNVKPTERGQNSKSEVRKNLRQLSGARRQLFNLKTPIKLRNPRRTAETFDPNAITEVYLISVLLGYRPDFFPFVEPIGGFTAHVFTREFLQVVLSELDTIADFTNYLRAKESFIVNKEFLTIMGGEEELLAIYLKNNRSFGEITNASFVHIEKGFWNEYRTSLEYQSKKQEDQISYAWDGLINKAHEGSKRYEVVARELARPTRFERRVLAKRFVDDQLTAHNDEIHHLYRAAFQGQCATYCFLYCDQHISPDNRKLMLKAICYVVRGKMPQNNKVIGIATEKKFAPSCSYDFCLLVLPVWTSENQRQMEILQKQFGIFETPVMKVVQETEYPH